MAPKKDSDSRPSLKDLKNDGSAVDDGEIKTHPVTKERMFISQQLSPPEHLQVSKTFYVCTEGHCPWRHAVDGMAYFQALQLFAGHNREKHGNSSFYHLRYGHVIVGEKQNLQPVSGRKIPHYR